MKLSYIASGVDDAFRSKGKNVDLYMIYGQNNENVYSISCVLIFCYCCFFNNPGGLSIFLGIVFEREKNPMFST